MGKKSQWKRMLWVKKKIIFVQRIASKNESASISCDMLSSNTCFKEEEEEKDIQFKPDIEMANEFKKIM